MAKRAFQLLLVACLATGTLWAANDPFVGKWKLNPSKSKLTDQMKVEANGEEIETVRKLKGSSLRRAHG